MHRLTQHMPPLSLQITIAHCHCLQGAKKTIVDLTQPYRKNLRKIFAKIRDQYAHVSPPLSIILSADWFSGIMKNNAH